MKQCRKCGKEKPLSEFYFKLDNAGGLTTKCKSCCLEYNKKYQHIKPKKVVMKRWMRLQGL